MARFLRFCRTVGSVMRFVHLMALAALPASLLAQEQSLPVLVGGDSDLDACGAIVTVKGLMPIAANYLNVRAGPGTQYPVVERINEGTEFFFCASSEDRSWLGIVLFSKHGEDCGLGEPIFPRQAYEGNCRSGWVHRTFTSMR